jgi:MFS family permease
VTGGVPQPAKDPLAIGLGALGTGAGLGGACITLMLLVIRLVQRVEIGRYGVGVSDVDPFVFGLIAIALAAMFGWRRSHALENLWQRGVITVLAVFGTLLIAILAVPFWHYLRFTGLVVLAVASLLLGLRASRWASAGTGAEEPKTGGGP